MSTSTGNWARIARPRACGVDHKTVARVVALAERGEVAAPRRQSVRERNYAGVKGLVARRVASSQGRISAKRLLPAARAEGYAGSDRNFRRLVAAAKVEWRRQGRRRPASASRSV